MRNIYKYRRTEWHNERNIRGLLKKREVEVDKERERERERESVWKWERNVLKVWIRWKCAKKMAYSLFPHKVRGSNGGRGDEWNLASRPTFWLYKAHCLCDTRRETGTRNCFDEAKLVRDTNIRLAYFGGSIIHWSSSGRFFDDIALDRCSTSARFFEG